MDNGTRIITEISVAGITFASFVDALPSVAAAVGAIYYAFQIWETPTVRSWRSRWNKS